MRQMGTMGAEHHIATRREAGSKADEVGAVGVEGIRTGEIGRALDRSPMIGVGVIRKGIWGVENTSRFPSSPLDLPN